MENFRHFEAVDFFGRSWKVDLLWIQNAISIRHADSIDAKFRLTSDEESLDKVIAIGHPDLLRLSAERRRPITDPWVSRLAAAHLKRVIETGEDLDKTLITVPYESLTKYAASLPEPASAL